MIEKEVGFLGQHINGGVRGKLEAVRRIAI